jgi:hypothetical protein
VKAALLSSVLTAISMTAVLGQSSTHFKTTVPIGTWGPNNAPPTMPQGWKRMPPEAPPETVVILYGQGGRVDEHNVKYAAYRSARVNVEIRGPCCSACTLIATYIDKDKLCFTERAFLGFHQVRSLETREVMPLATWVFYRQQPPEIRGWIDRTGGWENLPLDGYWPLRAPELWAMGYPKCQ